MAAQMMTAGAPPPIVRHPRTRAELRSALESVALELLKERMENHRLRECLRVATKSKERGPEKLASILGFPAEG